MSSKVPSPGALAALQAVQDIRETRDAYEGLLQLLEHSPNQAPAGQNQLPALMRVINAKLAQDVSRAEEAVRSV